MPISMEEFHSKGKEINPRKGRLSFGKRMEFSAIAELLKRGFDVYLTLVDDKAIDCIVRLSDVRYLDIQIKASSKKSMQPYNFGAIPVKNPRNNYFFIFYIEDEDKFWIIPSLDFSKLWKITTKEGSRHKGSFNVVIPAPYSRKRDLFKKYEGKSGFSLLKNN